MSASNSEEEDRLRSVFERHERAGHLRLPPEPQLCADIGVTRGRLRTLLRRAEEEGRIWRHVGKGTFVGSRPVAPDQIERDLSISVGDFMDARAVLEPQLAAQAALHAKPQDIEQLQALMAAMAASTCFSEWKRMDARLHRLIAHATHNGLLMLIYDTLRSPMRLGLEARVEEVFGTPPGPRAAANAQHAAIVAAIAARHPVKAEAAMRDHIHAVRALLFGQP